MLYQSTNAVSITVTGEKGAGSETPESAGPAGMALLPIKVFLQCKTNTCDCADSIALLCWLQATESPFINAIFDREPLDQFVWGRVALLGEAAHPTTPHGLRRYGVESVSAVVQL